MSGYKLHWEHFPLNQKGRDFVVGDIHGYYQALEYILKKVNFDPEKDRLFSVGDNIDRGPRSHEILDWLDKPWYFSTLGNHEVMAIEYFKSKGSQWKNWEIHGGKWFMVLPREEQEKYVNRFEKLPHVFEIDTLLGKIGIVHAECTPNDWLTFKYEYENHKDNALWGMSRFYNAMNGKHQKIENVEYVINGHMNVDHISKSENTIYLDTGKLAGKLTLLEISDPSGLHYHM